MSKPKQKHKLQPPPGAKLLAADRPKPVKSIPLLRGAAKEKSDAKKAEAAIIRRTALQELEVKGDFNSQLLAKALQIDLDALEYEADDDLKRRLGDLCREYAAAEVGGRSIEQVQVLANEMNVNIRLMAKTEENLRKLVIDKLAKRMTARKFSKLKELLLHCESQAYKEKQEERNRWQELLRRGGPPEKRRDRDEALAGIRFTELANFPQLMAKLNSGTPALVTVFARIMQICPSPAAGIVLSQLLFWHDLRRGGNLTQTRVGRFGCRKRYAELARETGLTVDQVRTACDGLVTAQLISRKGGGFRGKRTNILTPNLKVITQQLEAIARKERIAAAPEERQQILRSASETNQPQ